jgi:hypothetical protein
MTATDLFPRDTTGLLSVERATLHRLLAGADTYSAAVWACPSKPGSTTRQVWSGREDQSPKERPCRRGPGRPAAAPGRSRGVIRPGQGWGLARASTPPGDSRPPR